MPSNKKHKVLQVTPTVTSIIAKPSRLGFSKKKIKTEEILFDRWKASILSSIDSFKSQFKEKRDNQSNIIKEYKLIISELNKFQANLFEVILYKPANNTIVNELLSKLDLSSFFLIKKDYANYSLFVSLNYEDSIKFIELMAKTCNANTIDKSKKILKLIREFRLIPYSELLLLISNPKNNDQEHFRIFLDIKILRLRGVYQNEEMFYEEIKTLAKKFNLEVDKNIKSFSNGLILIGITGNLKQLEDFLLFFELEYLVFSEYIRTETYDVSGAADIKRELKNIPVKPFNDHLPIVCLLDSNLPHPNVLNNVIRSEIIGVYRANYDDDLTETDHAVQMASIIAFGDQLLNINDVDKLCDKGLISHAKIVSIMLGSKRPLFKIDDFHKILLEIKNKDELKKQHVKICNCSFNIKQAKKDCQGLSLLSYFIDRFLFFHTDYSVFSSVGNIDDDKRIENFRTFEEANIYVPSEAINVFSIGSISNNNGENIISEYSRKDSFDYGRIRGRITKVKTIQSIKRFSCIRRKPDILSIGNNWSPVGQRCRQQIYANDEKKSGTSHSAAFASNIAARCLSNYPEIKSALAMEAILLNSTESASCNVEFNLKQPFSEIIKERIAELSNKSHANLKCDWVSKEEQFLKNRFVGLSGEINIEKVLTNTNNVRTFIIESNIGIGTFIRQQIDLSEFLNEQILSSSTLSISGVLVYRGIPFIKDALGSNIINLSAKIEYFEDYITERNFYENLPEEEKEKYKPNYNRNWSSPLTCNYMWGNRQHLENVSTRKKSFRDNLIKNQYKLEILVQAIAWTGMEEEITAFIKNGLKDFYKNAEDCPKIWRNLWKNEYVNLEDIKVPYAIVLSIKTKQSINLYAEAELEVQQTLF